MPDSNRLAELQRQRSLVQEHLEWLNREIAAEEKFATAPLGAGEASAAAPDTVLTAAPATPTSTNLAAAELEADAGALLDEYRVAPHDLQREVRRGCAIYFVAALALLAATTALLYFAFRH